MRGQLSPEEISRWTRDLDSLYPGVAEVVRKQNELRLKGTAGDPPGGLESQDPWKAFTLTDAYGERPPVEYIVAGLFALPSVNIVYGAPGTLKSFFLADLAISVAVGAEWLPPAPWITGEQAQAIKTSQLSTMWLDFDNRVRRTHDRIAALARARDLPETTPFTYYSMPSPWLDATRKENIGALSLRILERGVRLAVIDNLGVISSSADENSAEMAQVMSIFRQVAEETGAAVALIHHQRKGNGATGRLGDALRGHSSIEAALDLALLVECEEQADTVIVKATKVRGADVLPFSAVFPCEDDPGSGLAKARFFGIATQDTQSNLAVRNVIKTALYGKARIGRIRRRRAPCTCEWI